ncbi:Por secretion system C-terminal sorting domain-containing protein [Chitinophaga jiangningensis]|uniref:Por secretion system C-terminal sorting domain-containing protein n=1 Tax=Chitinophaga jiangningensis TaxID=1419482 RepID=A0A1M7FL12_9BACT|nr:T9SS type A sorting domain-containing protein [Chitinophaga jiangningensis]SHM04665.1 Por secretion system C-terminal sorting domain-containing protein [Chitinophaga jiangningensis]
MNVFTRAGICILFLLSVCITVAHAQLILNRQVAATAGGSGTAGNTRIQYTIGEPMITLITDGRVLLTQGFQQPEELPPVDPGANVVKGFIIFPNPASTNLKVQLDLLAPAIVNLELINTAGQSMYREGQSMGAGRNTVVIAVNKFASGIYRLKIKVGPQIFFEKIIIQ